MEFIIYKYCSNTSYNVLYNNQSEKKIVENLIQIIHQLFLNSPLKIGYSNL